MTSRTWDHLHDMLAKISCPDNSGGGICTQLCIYAFRTVWIVVYDVGRCHMCLVINPDRDRLSLRLCIDFVMFLVYFQVNQYDIITEFMARVNWV